MHVDSAVRLTIAIPYRANLSYLRNAIDSVVAQSCGDFVCVVLDDSNSGEAEALVQNYKLLGIEYLKNPTPLGIARNWNQAIDIANTEFLTIFHADDIMEPNYVSTLLSVLSSTHDVAAVHCRAHLIDADGNSLRSSIQLFKNLIRPRYRGGQIVLEGDSGLKSLIRGDWIICPTMTYRIDVLRRLRFNESLQFALDLDLMGRMLLNGVKIMGIDTFEYRYRVHIKSQTSQMSLLGIRFLEEWSTIDQLGRFARRVNWHRSHRASRYKIVLRAHMVVAALQQLRNGRLTQVLKLMNWALTKPSTEELERYQALS
jgi:GT2 family glycosyltransferase